MITVNRYSRKPLKAQKWVMTADSGNLHVVADGEDLRKGIPHDAKETEHWGIALPLFTMPGDEAQWWGMEANAQWVLLDRRENAT